MRTPRPVPRPQLLRAAILCTVTGLILTWLSVSGHCEEPERPTPVAFKITIGALAGLAAIDTVQSVPCLQSPWCYEKNPLYKHASPAGFVAIKAAGISTVSVAAWKVRKTRPKLAWTLLGSMTALQGWAVVHNARVLRKRP